MHERKLYVVILYMASYTGLLKAMSTIPSLPSRLVRKVKNSIFNGHCTSQSSYHQQQTKLEESVSAFDGCDAYTDIQSIKRRDSILKIQQMLSKVCEPLEALELIDSLQRLGIDHHFNKEIDEIMESLYKNFKEETGFDKQSNIDGSLYEVSLLFRLIRNSGYHIPSDVFLRFTNKNGKFKQPIEGDVQGLLSLYEASFLSMDEDILDEAKEFSCMHLRASSGALECHAKTSMEHSLNYPLHFNLQRFEAQNHIRHYKGSSENTDILKEFAVMDFNFVQSLHRKELMEFTGWWRGTELFQELKFTRDQPLKWFMWTIAALSNPKHSKCRIELAKSIALVYTIDDIFDVYASLDELALFTEAVKKWDASPMNQLPRYMKICYSALYDITNEIASIVQIEHGWNPIHSLRKSWTALCEAFLVEAKWFARGYTPKPSEYLENGVISTGVHVVCVHLFYLVGEEITKENVDSLDNLPGLTLYPATILRLWDDLGSAKDENQDGFDGSYVECYLKEHCNSSNESAREHVLRMILNSWKKLNKEFCSASSFPLSFRKACLNSARMVQIMYSYKNQRLPLFEEYVKFMIQESV